MSGTMRAMCQSPPCTHTTPRAHHPCRAATDNTAHRLLTPTPPPRSSRRYQMAAGALYHRWGTAESDDAHDALHPPH